MRTLVTTLAFTLVLAVASIATAQPANTLVAEGLSLPKDHQYERYNASAGSYGKVDVSQVPALVKQKQPIYDRTAKAWVYQSAQGVNPKYAAAAAAAAPSTPAPSAPAPSTPAASAPAPSPTPAASAPAPSAPLVAEGLSLPKDHQYERYNASSSSYGKVDVSQVPALVKQKQPIYDRTAKAWVYQSGPGLNANYAAPGATASATTAPATTAPATTAPATTAPATTAPATTARAADGLSLPRDHQYERYNGGSNTYGKVDVSQVPTLIGQNVPIYDRTAKAWVYNTEGRLDPRYAAAPAGGASTTLSGTAGTPNLVLPKDHQYQRYNVTESTYAHVDASQVPTLVQQQVPVYDRTAKAWVFSPAQQLDPRYVSGATSASPRQ